MKTRPPYSQRRKPASQFQPVHWTAGRYEPFPQHGKVRISSPGKGKQAAAQTALRKGGQDQLEMAAHSGAAGFRHLQNIQTSIVAVRHHQPLFLTTKGTKRHEKN